MTRLLRCLIPLLALGATAAPSAWAQAPLAGTGENIQPIARVALEHPNEVELAGDWAFVSNDGVGLAIVNIADPSKPFIEGRWDCEAGWADVDISADSNLTVLTNAHSGECFEDATAVVILDTSDKKNPKLLSRIPYAQFDTDDDALGDYVHTATLDGDRLFLNPQAAAFYPQTPADIDVFDISDPRNPVQISEIGKDLQALAHDTYVDHRPDGKTLLYSGSIHTSDVFDITDIKAPSLLQQVFSPEITISHDVQPNHDRSIIVVDDEGAAGGQLSENVSVCGRFGGPGPAAVDSGSVHFYEAAPDGTFANGGLVELGSWNAPANANEGACVAHVFWQAPDENRLTQGYYRMGAFILDFEDPANPQMLGSFKAEGGSNYWSVKPHRGYLFATDQDGATPQEGGGLDILRYTGEGGKRWPATSGPAEVQRAARHGVPYEPIPLPGQEKPAEPQPLPPAEGPVERSVGRVRFTAKLKRIPGRRGKRVNVRFVFRDADGRKVGTARVRRKAGRRAKVRVYGGAVTGRYRWTAKAGRRVVGRGRIRVKRTPNMTLAPSKRLSVVAR